mgnify:CR=1 FL=1
MSGKTVRGNLVASDPEALLNELKKQDLFLLDYTQTNKTSFGSKLKPKELTDFCRQLGSLLDAGVSVIQSFNIISNRASISKFAKKSFSDITTDLKHGKALSEAMADQGKVFPELLISMVRAGEASGKIGDTFLSMGQHFQKQQRINLRSRARLDVPHRADDPAGAGHYRDLPHWFDYRLLLWDFLLWGGLRHRTDHADRRTGDQYRIPGKP